MDGRFPPSDPIRVLHITPTLSLAGGGTATYLWAFAEAGLACGLTPTVACLHDQHVDEEAAKHPGVRTITAKHTGPRSMCYSPALRRLLIERAADAQVVHCHALRSWHSYLARQLAQRFGVPLVVSPHGQMDPWILRKRVTRKQLIGWLFENRNLSLASCIHVTSDQEARYVREASLTNPVAVVTIGLDAQSYTLDGDESLIAKRWPALRGKKRLLFLSSIYRKKGLPRLAEAWCRIHKQWPNWRLVVSGIEVDGDCELAKRMIREQGDPDSAVFTGETPEALKKQLLAGCDLFVLPTDGENFGIVIAEAMASGLPVITSNTTPWGDLQEHHCGWWIDVGVPPLERALAEAMGLPDDQRRQMGRRARSLIEQKYQWPTVARRMRQTYEWLLDKSPQPGFVYRADQPVPLR